MQNGEKRREGNDPDSARACPNTAREDVTFFAAGSYLEPRWPREDRQGKVHRHKAARLGRPALRRNKKEKSGGRFGAENALEARAGELDANELFALGAGIGDVDDAAMGGEVRVVVSGARKAVIIPGARRSVDAARSIIR